MAWAASSTMATLEFLGDAVEPVHVSALAVKVDGKNGANIFGWRGADLPGAQFSADEGRVKIQGAGIDIHEHGGCTRPHDGAG